VQLSNIWTGNISRHMTHCDVISHNRQKYFLALFRPSATIVKPGQPLCNLVPKFIPTDNLQESVVMSKCCQTLGTE